MNGDAAIPLKFLKRGVKLNSLINAIKNAAPAFDTFLPIKKAKYDDVMSLLECVNLPENVTFFDSIRGDE